MSAGRLRFLATSALILAFYYLAARLGLLIAFKGTNVSPVWPPAGIALGSMLVFGYGVWPAIAVAAFLANYSTGLSAAVSLAICIGNTMEAMVGTYVVRRLCGSRNPLENPRDLSILFLASALGVMSAASIGTIAVTLGGYAPDIDPAYLWSTWWLGDMSGIFVLAPLILAWSRSSPKANRPRFVQALLLYILLAAIGQMVFSRLSPFGIPLTYLTVPPIVIAAFRHRQHGASVAIVLLAAIATWETVRGHGPFYLGTLNQSLLFLQLFVLVIAATALVLAAVVEELAVTAGARNQLLESEKQLRMKAEEALKVKQVLIQEVHHRVKNNLQVITSMLNLQARNYGGTSAEKLFAETRARIRAISLIHERLYGTENLLRIDFGDYVRSLADEIFSAYNVDHGSILFSLDCTNLELGVDKAVPLALITNELLSNSIKHAFPDNRAGKICLDIARQQEKIQFWFRDDGVGISQPMGTVDSRKFGLHMIEILTKQIQGEKQSTTTSGVDIRIVFPAE